jgi:hypothetical protein
MSAKPNTPADDGEDFMTPEWQQQRADDLDAMNGNVFMRNNATLDDDGLADFLDGAQVQGRANHGSYEIVFGFDQYGDDFLIVRGKTADSLHAVFSQ